MKTLEEICSGIRRWNKYKNDIHLLQRLHEIRGLAFEVGEALLASQNFHVYFALDKEKTFAFYLISSIYDTEKTLKAEDIVEALPIFNVTQDVIPNKEAYTRISNWEDPLSFASWSLSSIKTNTVVEAFYVPGSDIEIDPGTSPENFNAFFGLKPNLSDTPGKSFQIDLILYNNTHLFYDTVMPVPPFGAKKFSHNSEERFYLLELALKPCLQN